MSFKIKSRIWIEHDDKVLLGKGRISLLKAIEETGSLSKAAKSMNLSYKKAWHLVDSINRASKNPVTINSIGGKGGGGSELTDYGKSLISAFEAINKNCWEFLDDQIDQFQNL